MWIITDRGFISVVAHRDDPSLLLVRARVRADLPAIFPFLTDADVYTDEPSDYRYRADITRDAVARAITDAIVAIDYDSHFKEAARDRSAPSETGQSRYSALLSMWTAGARLTKRARSQGEPLHTRPAPLHTRPAPRHRRGAPAKARETLLAPPPDSDGFDDWCPDDDSADAWW